ncbi:MAG: right-handed parallel beta-helix repeat-containing protein [Candidatus Thorarchaeota archaeon]
MRKMNPMSIVTILILITLFPVGSVSEPSVTEVLNQSLPADYISHAPIVITSDSDFETQGWPGEGSPEEPYKIEGLSINGSSAEICVSIEYTQAYFIIRDCHLFNGTYGIKLDNANNGLIDCNEIDNVGHGVMISESENNTVFHNTIIGELLIDSHAGIRISTDSFNTTVSTNNCTGPWLYPILIEWHENCTISNNFCSSSREESVGIFLRYALNSTLINNTCEMNTYEGIYVYGSLDCMILNNTSNMNGRTGIAIGNSENSKLINNTAISNTDYGFGIDPGEGCVFVGNTIMNNGFGIIALSGTTSNKVYGNIIGWNNIWNARDYGYGNSWDDGISIGNRWGDYTGSEIYYWISGGTVDHYPLKADIVLPVIDAPIDIEYELGTTGQYITWSPTDDHPDMYQIMRNGVVIDAGVWDGTDITHDVSGLVGGVYNYSLKVNDTCANFAFDDVLVTVPDTVVPIIEGPDDFHYEYGTTNHNIIWKVIEFNPHYFEVFRNETQIDSGQWNGSDIVISSDGLDLGTYNYTLTVSDASNNNASSTVMVSVEDTISPVISSLEDTQFTIGTTGHNLTWVLEDPNPFSYEVVMHSIVITSGTWNSTGETVTIILDYMIVGTHFITITITDLGGNEESDVVIVSILPASIATDPMLFLVIVSGGAGAVLVVIIIILVKRKKS